eukprot:TRINITY_DN5044_c0_g1_i1.p1 TRINITY_DN5044_c0_g1~~TRINITY_DN5044_c0_g1_i1.p1  ORF type:complete len:549 (+),score=103.12 TRINITY_DN5044_c0_g1_i1:98-1744(+)
MTRRLSDGASSPGAAAARHLNSGRTGWTLPLFVHRLKNLSRRKHSIASLERPRGTVRVVSTLVCSCAAALAAVSLLPFAWVTRVTPHSGGLSAGLFERSCSHAQLHASTASASASALHRLDHGGRRQQRWPRSALTLASGPDVNGRPADDRKVELEDGAKAAAAAAAASADGGDDNYFAMASDIKWLPPVESMQDLPASNVSGTTVLPIFPLSNSAYMPESEQIINVYEPRYRALYNDILVSGSRRFVVSAIHPVDGRFAKIGVVLYLEDLRDVSEETRGEIKFICTHRVIGRVRIDRVLNPSKWEDAETYLRVETTPYDDEGEEDEVEVSHETEEALMSELKNLTELQQRLDGVHFTYDIAEQMNASRDGGGLWSLAALWGEYFDFLIEERENLLEADLERKSSFGLPPGDHNYLRSQLINTADPFLDYGDAEDEDVDDLEPDYGAFMSSASDALDYDDFLPEDMEDVFEQVEMNVPPAVLAEMRQLQEEHTEEVQNLLVQQSEATQAVLQCRSHKERLAVLKAMFRTELARLGAKKALTEALESDA